MKINKKSIIFLANRHYFEIDNDQIDELIYEINFLIKYQKKNLNNSKFDSFKPLFLPSFIKGDYLRSDLLENNQSKIDFFQNVKLVNSRGYVFISKTKVKKCKK